MNSVPLKKRKYDKSHGETIWRVRQYFENELRQGKRIKLSHVVERTTAATGVAKNIICRLKSADDLKNWHIQHDARFGGERVYPIPENFDIIVRQTVRDLFLEKKQMPSLKRILTELAGLKVRDIVHPNIFEGFELPKEDSTVWPWSQTKLWRYLKKMGSFTKIRLPTMSTQKQEQILSI